MSSPSGLILSSCEPLAVNRHPVFSNSFWMNSCQEESSLHAWPVHWVIRILLSFAEILPYHISRFSSFSSHICIAFPIFCFIAFPNPASTGCTYLCGYLAANKLLYSFLCMLHGILVLTGNQHYQQTTPSL